IEAVLHLKEADRVTEGQTKRAQILAIAGLADKVALKPRGLGPWLWLLIFGFVIYGVDQLNMVPIFFAQAEAKTPGLAASADWQAFKHVMWLLLGLQAILGLYLAVRLFCRRNRRTIYLIIAVLWLMAPVRDLLIFTSIRLTLGNPGIGAILSGRLSHSEM